VHGEAGDRVVTRLPGDQSAVPAARRFAGQAAADYGGDADCIDTTKLLVTEVATNAVVHAHSPIRLTVSPEPPDALRVEVRDDDPTPPPLPCVPDADPTSGRGLWLVSALARRWGVNRNAKGKTVWFEVDGNGKPH
jgi:anti-sigma regulatory factor (Ser/Thr protein kinase)